MQPQSPETDIDKVPLSSIEFWGGQWRTLYAKQRRLHDANTRQILLGQLFTLAVTMAGGLLLEQNKEALLLVGSTLLLYPVIADMLSSSAAVLTARIHHEYDNPESSRLTKVVGPVASTIFVTVLTATALGVIAGLAGYILFGSDFMHTLQLSALAGSFAGAIGYPIMVVVTLLVRKLNNNPDDINAPIETTVFNMLTLLSIVLVSRIIT